ncbi:hypothetical protein [Microcoleus sp. Pol7_B2]|uniref:hypothetical protein n=2 Tax=Microcoleus TaxID=44471 RepID=UPI002FD65A7A
MAKKPKLDRSGRGGIDMISKCHRWTAMLVNLGVWDWGWRSRVKLWNCTAIALTAYAGDFNQKQALAAGFQHHVAKRVEANELVKAMLKLPLRLHS